MPNPPMNTITTLGTVDDVLATGGTAGACIRLIEAAGVTVVGTSFLVELSFLEGRKRLEPHRVESGIIY